jgi:hypothetical protein
MNETNKAGGADLHAPVATVKSFTNGSYWRNYKLAWHRDVPTGTNLYDAAAVVALIAERDALAAEVKALKADAERWAEVARRYDNSKTPDAVSILRGLGMEETPYRSFAENVDAARTASAVRGE